GGRPHAERDDPRHVVRALRLAAGQYPDDREHEDQGLECTENHSATVSAPISGDHARASRDHGPNVLRPRRGVRMVVLDSGPGAYFLPTDERDPTLCPPVTLARADRARSGA